MNINKINAYLRCSGELFPNYMPLSVDKILLLLNEIYTIIGVESKIDSKTIFEAIRNSKSIHRKAVSDTYDLSSIIEEVGFPRKGKVYLLWNEVDDCDKMNIEDVITVWSDIWYDDADEAIILFNDDQKRLLMLTDWGELFYN